MTPDGEGPPSDADLRQELRRLSLRLDDVVRRLTAVERRLAEGGASATVPEAPPVPIQSSPPPAPPPPPEPPVAAAVPVGPAALASHMRDLRAEQRSAPVTPTPTGVAAPPPAFAPTPPPAAPIRKPTVPFERRIGVSWFVKIGVLSILLAAAFFFKYAVDRGWIDRPVRCVIIAAGGLVLLGAGEWALRRRWRVVSAGLTGGGVALLYAAAFAASPNFYGLIGTPAALALMCAATAAAVALSLRADLMSSSILAMIGAYLTPVLLSSGTDQQTALMVYLLVVDAGFLALGALKQWRPLTPVAWGGTAVLFTAWMVAWFGPDKAPMTTLYAWLLYGVLAGQVLLSAARDREQRLDRLILVTCGGAIMTLGLVAIWRDTSAHSALAQVLVVALVGLGFAWWRGWHLPRPIIWGQAAAALLHLGVTVSPAIQPETGVWDIVPWIWAFGALFVADVVVRSRRVTAGSAWDVVLASVTVAAMFGAVYGLLYSDYGEWMGGYTALLAVGSLVLSGWLHRAGRPQSLVFALVLCGLALITVAVPIQFDAWTIKIAWAVQAVMAMVVARALGSRLMLVTSVVALFLAVARFATVGGTNDPVLAATWFTWAEAAAPYALLMALGLSAACFVCAAMVLRWRAAPPGDGLIAIGHVFLWTGSVLILTNTHAHLPASAAGWAWWVLAVAVAVAVRPGRSRAGSLTGILHLLIVAGRWFAWDTLGRRLTEDAGTGAVILNPQFLLGLAVAVSLAWLGRRFRRLAKDDDHDLRTLASVLVLLAAITPVWGLSFEVDRYVTGHADVFADPGLARHMGWSILWAVYAAGLIVVGFAVRRAVLRYAAMAILAVTLVKVFLVDMAGVNAIYRILSFLALGAVLVVLSVVYQRYFSRLLRDNDTPAPTP